MIFAFTSLYWITGVLLLSYAAFLGTTRLLVKSYDADKTWDYIEKYKVSFLFMAPILAHEFSIAGQDKKRDTSSLKTFFTGGTAVSPKMLEELRNQLPGTFISQGYGQTEVGGVITYFDTEYDEDVQLSLKNPTSCGRPVPGLTYKVIFPDHNIIQIFYSRLLYQIVDPVTEEIVGFNQRGELRVKTAVAMVGYYKLDSSSAWDKEGWLKTGDILCFDEDFCFYVVDRLKEMLKYKSWHVAPALIENVILSHPSVKECVVVGAPHEIDGDHPAALVVLKDEAPEHLVPRDILEYTNKRVDERHKLRAGLIFVKHLIYTATGKPNRKELRDSFLQNQVKSLMT